MIEGLQTFGIPWLDGKFMELEDEYRFVGVRVGVRLSILAAARAQLYHCIVGQCETMLR